jgi:hypothetical protein
MGDEQELRTMSDRLIEEADAVRALERRKRRVPISTPEFHGLADEIERRARHVFKIAGEEESIGEDVPTQPRSIDDVAQDRLP